MKNENRFFSDVRKRKEGRRRRKINIYISIPSIENKNKHIRKNLFLHLIHRPTTHTKSLTRDMQSKSSDFLRLFLAQWTDGERERKIFKSDESGGEEKEQSIHDVDMRENGRKRSSTKHATLTREE